MSRYLVPVPTCCAKQPCGVGGCGRCYGREWQHSHKAGRKRHRSAPPAGTPCSRCGAQLDGLRKHRYCRDCSRIYAREARRRPGQREKHVGAHRLAKYGIPPEKYAAMLQQQGGLCAICRQPERAKRRGIPKTLAVDHDHDRGSLRGLLCSRCNTALGLFGEDPSVLRAAIGYLRPQPRMVVGKTA